MNQIIKRTLTVLSLVLLAHLLIAVPVRAEDYVAQVEGQEYSDLQAAINAAAGADKTQAKTVTLIKDVEIGHGLTVTGYVTLDLNGYGIRLKENQNQTKPGTDSIISIGMGRHLTIIDSGNTEHYYIIMDPSEKGEELAKVCDKAAYDKWTGKKGSFKGGYITGGYGNVERGGTDYLGGGVRVQALGSLEMTGGTIIGNTATKGGGVHVHYEGKFSISGRVNIIYNGGEGNVFLQNKDEGNLQSYITLAGPLDPNSRIGVVKKSTAIGNAFVPQVITEGLEGRGSLSNFICEAEGNTMMLNDRKEATFYEMVNLTFNANDGSGATKVQTLRKNIYETLTPNPFPAPAGAVFDGWAITADGEKLYDDKETVRIRKVTTLYARWKYGVTLKGGTGGGNYMKGDTVEITADKIEAGKLFYKWVSDDGVEFDDPFSRTTTFTMPERPVTVTPTYIEVTVVTSADREVTCSGKAVTVPVKGMFTIPKGAGTPTYTVTGGTGKGTYNKKTNKLKVTKGGTFIVIVATPETKTHTATYVAATLTVKVPVTGISLNKKKVTLNLKNKKTIKLTATIKPTAVDNKKVVWSTSNKKVATVSKSGKVTAKKAGTTTITATTVNGGRKATCKITVKKK